MEQHEVDALIERIDGTDFGPEETKLVGAALALVSRGEDPEREYRVRLRAMLSSSYHGRFEEFLEHFAFCLETHRADPGRFPEREGGISLRAYQGRAVAALVRRSATPLATVHAVLEDYEDYFRQLGTPPRKPWELRAELALHTGDVPAARAWRERLRTLPRNEGVWCAGCEAVLAAAIEEDAGELEDVLHVLDEVHDGDPNCSESGWRLAAIGPLAMAAEGEGERALHLHRLGVRTSRRAGVGRAPELARHAAFAALTEHPERAVQLANLALGHDRPEALSSVARFETLTHSWLALAAALDDGWAAEPVPAAAAWLGPGATPAGRAAGGAVDAASAPFGAAGPDVASGAAASAPLGTAAVAEALWRAATDLAAELDAHFGAGVFARRLDRIERLRPQRFRVPWARVAADLAPTGLGASGRADGSRHDGPGHDVPGPARPPRPTDVGQDGAPVPHQGPIDPWLAPPEQEWLDAVALPALVGDAERAGAVIERAILAISDPSMLLELYSEAIDVLPEQKERWYARRAELFARVGMHDHARLERELRDLMSEDHEAGAADVPRWREALTWLTTDAARAEVLTHLARALLESGETREAAQASIDAAALAHAMPSRGDALWVLGEGSSVLASAGRIEEALELSDRAAELALVGERNTLVWRHQRGLLLSRAGREEEAIDFFRQAADVAIEHHLHPVAIHLLMQAGGRAYYFDLNVQAAAYQRLARKLALNSADERYGVITMRLAAALEDAGEPDEAAGLLTELLGSLRHNPLDPLLADVREGSLLRYLGDALGAADDARGAIEAWRGCLALERPGVQAALEAGLEPDPDAASDAYNAAMGLARFTVGEAPPEAIADLVRFSSTAAPHSQQAVPRSLGLVEDSVAQLLSRVGLHAEAETHARAAVDHFEQAQEPIARADALDTLGRVVLAAGRAEEGVELLRRASSESAAAGAPEQAVASLLGAAREIGEGQEELGLLQQAFELSMTARADVREAAGLALARALEAAGRGAEAAAVRGKIE